LIQSQLTIRNEELAAVTRDRNCFHYEKLEVITEKKTLETRVNSMTHKKNDLEARFEIMSRTKDDLEARFEIMSRMKDDLEARFEIMSRTKDDLEAIKRKWDAYGHHHILIYLQSLA